jgi:thioredoxin reductase (NADPH)
MITAEEIGTVAAFAALDADGCERLAHVAADVSLVAGEYAANEGDERALFAVLSGRIEAVKLVDGIDRVLGSRAPGDLFGEVPITLGTVFPVGFRAAEASRVLRLEPQDYHAIAALEPEVAKEVGRMAGERISGPRGLAGIAAEPPPPRAIVVGDRFDPATTELRRFLDRNQVSHRWLDPHEQDAPAQWEGPLPGPDDRPAIRVIGGRTVLRPSHRRVAELVSLTTEPEGGQYDTVIVGGGPAGLAAAVYGASEGLRTVVVEREAPGGQAGTSSKIENYLGFPSGVSGDELAARALQQARRLGAEILVTRSIERVDAGAREIHLDGGEVLCTRTLILACGVRWRHLEIDGFERLVGKGISYGSARSEASGVHGLDVHIIGAGNSAGQAAMNFARHARSVTMICRSEAIEKSMSRYLIDQVATRPNIRARLSSGVTAAHGETSLEAIDVRDHRTGETERLISGGLFVFIGADAETGWLPDEIARDERGYVLTGADARDSGKWRLERDPGLLETTMPGVFACGDVRSSPVKRVAAAVGEGSMAIAFVHQHIRDAGS